MTEFPPRILLATDLSARSDRATDRAAQLAREHGSELVALYVMEQGQGADALSWRHAAEDEVESQIRHALGREEAAVTVAMAEGPAAPAILQAAQERDCGLVVMGVARHELFGPTHLGATTRGVVTRSRAPVLVVKTRVAGPYRRMVAASDFSNSSMHALETAAHFLPSVEPSLFHAFRVPYEGFTSRASSGDWFEQEAGHERDEFLARIKLAPEFRERLKVIVEYGSIHELLDVYVRDTRTDLAVVASHGRSGIFAIPIGNEALKLVAEAPCDVLIVPEPQARG